MNFVGTGKKLEDLDLPRIGAQIGVGEDEIHAFLEVETRGGGWDSKNRLKMLFEPHVFWRELGSGEKRDTAVAKGLAYQRWGTIRYPKDSYPRLIEAMEIDADAALRSASWGIGQTMGFNCKLCGYPTAQAMVEDYLKDEDIQLEGAIAFVVSNNLDDELRRHDWSGFARGYNGAGYAQNGYHTKLARAFAKWQAIPDTPFEIDRTPVDPNPEPEAPDVVVRDYPTLRMGDRGPEVSALQIGLSDLGYFSGKVDGKFGSLTRGAVLAFQADNGLVTDGIAGENTRNAMKAAEPRPKRKVNMDDLADSGTLKDQDEIDRGADVGAVGGVGLGSYMVLAQDAKDAVDSATEAAEGASGLLGNLTDLITNNWPAVLLIAGALVFWLILRGKTYQTRRRRLQDAIDGKHAGR